MVSKRFISDHVHPAACGMQDLDTVYRAAFTIGFGYTPDTECGDEHMPCGTTACLIHVYLHRTKHLFHELNNEAIPFAVVRPQHIDHHWRLQRHALLWHVLVRKQLGTLNKVDSTAIVFAALDMHCPAEDSFVLVGLVGSTDTGQRASGAIEAKEGGVDY